MGYSGRFEMVPVDQSLQQLEKAHQLQQALVASFKAAVLSMAHYAVELDPAITPPHRRYLREFAESIRSPVSLESVGEWRAALRCELRDYRDRAGQYLNVLRQELAAK